MSVLFHLQTDLNTSTVSELRRMVCDHLQTNASHYMPFFSQDSVKYNLLTERVKENGIWNESINEAVPLAVANILQTKLRILTSNPVIPCITIDPSLPPDETSSQEAALRSKCQTTSTILFGYLAAKDHENYDPVVRVDWRRKLRKVRNGQAVGAMIVRTC